MNAIEQPGLERARSADSLDAELPHGTVKSRNYYGSARYDRQSTGWAALRDEPGLPDKPDVDPRAVGAKVETPLPHTNLP
jgi:hypothetical protein